MVCPAGTLGWAVLLEQSQEVQKERAHAAAPPVPPHNLIHLPKGLSPLFPLFISAEREPPLCRDLPNCCPLKPNQPAPIQARLPTHQPQARFFRRLRNEGCEWPTDPPPQENRPKTFSS